MSIRTIGNSYGHTIAGIAITAACILGAAGINTATYHHTGPMVKHDLPAGTVIVYSDQNPLRRLGEANDYIVVQKGNDRWVARDNLTDQVEISDIKAFKEDGTTMVLRAYESNPVRSTAFDKYADIMRQVRTSAVNARTKQEKDALNGLIDKYFGGLNQLGTELGK